MTYLHSKLLKLSISKENVSRKIKNTFLINGKDLISEISLQVPTFLHHSKYIIYAV